MNPEKESPAPIDYRALLKKYMSGVLEKDVASIDFVVVFLTITLKMGGLSEEEKDELYRIEDELKKKT